MTFVEVFPPLPKLEATLVSLVLELLRASATYPQLVLSQPIDTRGEVSPDAVRFTHHYVTALQAFGYQLKDAELENALRWFMMPFPRDQYTSIDPAEMNRLEALLALCPPNADFTRPELVEYIQPRLECLLRQRSAGDDDEGGHFMIHGDNPAFDNLWAIKVLCMAHERHILRPNMMEESTLNRWLDERLIGDYYKDKDLSLALRLRYQYLSNTFRKNQKRLLDRVVKHGRTNFGVWDLRGNLTWLVHHMHRQELQIGDVAENAEAFRDMIVSTCYVIENLMPMMPTYPQLVGAVQEAMELWWGAFHGEDAAEKLRGLFPKPYDYLQVLTRTIVAVCAYAGAYSDKPLSERVMPHVYRTLADNHSIENSGSRVQRNIQQALHEWVPLDIDGEPQKLTLGLSGANVVRIKPRLRNPLNPEFALQFVDSLIVKYGPAEMINLERKNYARLPQVIRDCFVNIPQDSYIDSEEDRVYVIMADLAHHVTLYERLPTLHQIRDDIVNELGPFLMKMHRGGETQPPKDYRGLLWQAYLIPMQEYVGRCFRLLREYPLLGQDDLNNAFRLQDDLNTLLGTLVQQQLKLGEFPTAYMHGDLHSRNIMLRQISRWDNNGSGRNLDFKLIDLEKFESTGDAAVDAGQLLVDLELARRKMNQGDFAYASLSQLMEQLADQYELFGQERDDETFPARVQLGKARALLRIAKGQTKVAEARLKESRKAPAIDTAREIVNFATQAMDHLLTALEATRGHQPSLMD